MRHVSELEIKDNKIANFVQGTSAAATTIPHTHSHNSRLEQPQQIPGRQQPYQLDPPPIFSLVRLHAPNVTLLYILLMNKNRNDKVEEPH